MKPLCWLSHPYGGDPSNLDRAERAAVAFQRQHPEVLVVAPWITWARANAHENEAEALADCCAFIRRFCRAFATCGATYDDMTDGQRKEYGAALDAGCVVYVYETEAPR